MGGPRVGQWATRAGRALRGRGAASSIGRGQLQRPDLAGIHRGCSRCRGLGDRLRRCGLHRLLHGARAGPSAAIACGSPCAIPTWRPSSGSWGMLARSSWCRPMSGWPRSGGDARLDGADGLRRVWSGRALRARGRQRFDALPRRQGASGHRRGLRRPPGRIARLVSSFRPSALRRTSSPFRGTGEPRPRARRRRRSGPAFGD